MNNEQFRRLLVDNSSSSKSDEKKPTPGRNAPGGATPSGGLLGSRMRSSIPMTPYVSLDPTSFLGETANTCPCPCTGAPSQESTSPVNLQNSGAKAINDLPSDSSPPPRRRVRNYHPDIRTAHNYAMRKKKKTTFRSASRHWRRW